MTASPTQVIESLRELTDQQHSIALSNMELSLLGSALDLFTKYVGRQMSDPESEPEMIRVNARVLGDVTVLSNRLTTPLREAVRDKLVELGVDLDDVAGVGVAIGEDGMTMLPMLSESDHNHPRRRPETTGSDEHTGMYL